MIVRRERPGDIGSIRAVQAEAFRRTAPPGREPVEAALVDALRRGHEWIDRLSLVAVDPRRPAEIVGHVVCSRAWVGADRRALVGLGPIGVLPDRQRRGIGSALVHAVLAAAEALDEPAVVLLGSPAYYGRFGFEPASRLGIIPPRPEWEPHLQVRPLTAYDPALRGEFRYAAAFDGL